MTVKIGAKVKLNIKELKLEHWYGVEAYKDYILSDEDRIYTVVAESFQFGDHYILDDETFKKVPFCDSELIVIK